MHQHYNSGYNPSYDPTPGISTKIHDARPIEGLTTVMDPTFMKSLIKCHLMRVHARNRVFQNKYFYKHLIKVFKWKSQIAQEAAANRRNQASEIDISKNCDTNDSGKPEVDIEIIRRNIWLELVRKDILPAHRRRVNFRNDRLHKSKSTAHRCASHHNVFMRKKVQQQSNNKNCTSNDN